MEASKEEPRAQAAAQAESFVPNSDSHARELPRARAAPARLSIGMLMLMIVPIAVCLAAFREAPLAGVLAVCLFVSSALRARRLLARRRLERGSTTSVDLARAFWNSFWIIALRTAVGILVFLVPLLIGAIVAVLLSANGFGRAWIPFAMIAVALLGVPVGLVLASQFVGYVLRNCSDPWEKRRV
jgi:hypothetical protein